MKRKNLAKSTKIKKKRKSYQEFIDEINDRLKEKKEIEELFKRVIILNADDVLKEMEIKEKNNKIMRLHYERKEVLQSSLQRKPKPDEPDK